MSTTELDPGAGAAAPETEQTALPEQQTAGDAHQQSDAAETADEAKDEAGDKLTPEQREIRKRDRRIERLTAKRGAAEREAELLRQQLAEFQRATSRQEEGNAEQPGSRTLTEADIERIARQKADEITRQRAIGEKVSKVLKEGAKLEGFNAAVDAVAEVVPFTDSRGKPTPFIEAVLKARDPAAMFKHLGDNPDEAEALAGLDSLELGWQLAELQSRISQDAKAKTSSAPRPLQPLSARNAGFSSPRTSEDLLNELRSLRGK
jgi:hypothetical protein